MRNLITIQKGMSKKNNKGFILQLPSFESNKTIESFVEERPFFKKSINKIRVLLLREGAKSCHSFLNELALDLDDIEKRQGFEQMDRTVDFVIGCLKNTLLLAEAKLKVKDAHRLSRKELVEKINHSKDIIRSEHYIVHSSTVLLLDSCHFEQNKNKVYRLFNNKQDIIVPLTVEGFYKEVFEK